MRRGSVRSAGAGGRRGHALVELALVLPLLAFMLIAVFDFGRAFNYSITVATCARNGALYASDSSYASKSGYSSVTEAALKDAGRLSPAPSVSSTNGTDSSGDAYVEVTVTYPFAMISRYPGFSNPLSIRRTVRMRTIHLTPDTS